MYLLCSVSQAGTPGGHEWNKVSFKSSIFHSINSKLCRSSEARPVPFSNYLKLLEYLVNKVNVIRGPVPYMVRIYLSPLP